MCGEAVTCAREQYSSRNEKGESVSRTKRDSKAQQTMGISTICLDWEIALGLQTYSDRASRYRAKCTARHLAVHLGHRRPPYRLRLPCPVVPYQQDHLPADAYLGEPYSYCQGLGVGGQALQVSLAFGTSWRDPEICGFWEIGVLRTVLERGVAGEAYQISLGWIRNAVRGG